MLRKIIKIDDEKCIGCGICAKACHEGAIEMVDGLAKLTREDYCDGLGDCLPACPAGAISFEEREAPAYDEEAVKANMLRKKAEELLRACPGVESRELKEGSWPEKSVVFSAQSKLSQWPCQIKLVPANAPYFDGADLLIAADCTAYAYGNFHEDFIKNRIVLIGCPKLDGDYSAKLKEIFEGNNIRSVTLCRMEVPCCGGLGYALERALKSAGKNVPVRVVTISTDGKILGK